MSGDDDVLYADINRVADDRLRVETSPESAYTLRREGDFWVTSVELPTEVVAALTFNGYDLCTEDSGN